MSHIAKYIPQRDADAFRRPLYHMHLQFLIKASHSQLQVLAYNKHGTEGYLVVRIVPAQLDAP